MFLLLLLFPAGSLLLFCPPPPSAAKFIVILNCGSIAETVGLSGGASGFPLNWSTCQINRVWLRPLRCGAFPRPAGPVLCSASMTLSSSTTRVSTKCFRPRGCVCVFLPAFLCLVLPHARLCKCTSLFRQYFTASLILASLFFFSLRCQTFFPSGDFCL